MPDTAEVQLQPFSGPSILPHQLHRPHPERRRRLALRQAQDDRLTRAALRPTSLRMSMGG